MTVRLGRVLTSRVPLPVRTVVLFGLFPFLLAEAVLRGRPRPSAAAVRPPAVTASGRQRDAPPGDHPG